MRTFKNFAVVDWSGEAVEKPKGIAVASAEAGNRSPVLLRPDGGWSREGILQWLERLSSSNADVLIGLDLSPALPFADYGSYFPGWSGSPVEARSLWALVEELSVSDPHLGVASTLQHPELKRHFRQLRDCGDLFPQGRGRMRVCEHGQKSMGLSPTSCFNLVGASQVGKSSLTGMRVLHRLKGKVPFWPFDDVPTHGPVLVEIYTTVAALAAGRSKTRSKIRSAGELDTALAALGSDPHLPLRSYDDHSTDAIITTAWLRQVAQNSALWNPSALTSDLARTEGWTFGII